jgi:hypothetical protein
MSQMGHMQTSGGRNGMAKLQKDVAEVGTDRKLDVGTRLDPTEDRGSDTDVRRLRPASS